MYGASEETIKQLRTGQKSFITTLFHGVDQVKMSTADHITAVVGEDGETI
jgi:hypothetical protein